jgi:transketolase
LPLDELKNFRQWGSKKPWHSEQGYTPGIEATMLGRSISGGGIFGWALRFGKLIVLYDSNNISLDGKLSLSFSESVSKRFGWQYLRMKDGADF